MRLIRLLHLLSIGCLLSPSGCSTRAAEGPIEVGVIGAALDRAGPDDAARLALRAATGVGIVRFDQAGQLVPGAAARWAIVGDGLDGVFRIDDAIAGGAKRVAPRLRASLTGPARRLFGEGIDHVAAVTDAVVEIRLTEPRTDLLAMLADPVLATLAPEAGAFRRHAPIAGGILLEPRRPDDGATPAAVMLHGERAGRAVAGFAAARRRLVLGGTFADLSVARVAALPRDALRIDPATGLFGLAPRAAHGPFADEPLRRALALALDRDRIVAAFGVAGIAKATTIAGSRVEPPAAERLAAARAIVAGRRLPPLRLLLPDGPGGRLLFRLLSRDWARLGIATVPARAAADADFVLVDQVLPASELARAACIAAAGCDPAEKRALLQPPFIPLAQPIRWSLVDPTLDLFTENALAQHPLDRLRTPR